MGAVERIFLGWDQPAVVSAAEVIVSRFGGGGGGAASAGFVDLSPVTLVAPGGRAQRLLLAALLDRAGESAPGLTPPTMLTPGRLVGAARACAGRPASAFVSALAWAKAASEQRPADIAPLIPRPPARDDLPAWMALTSILREASQALASNALRFGDVAAQAAGFPGFEDGERWLAAARVQRAYERALADAGLHDAHLAQIDASASARERDAPGATGPLVLFATPDLTRVAERAIRERPGATLALVFAPEALADRFDDMGRPIAAKWIEAHAPLGDDQIEFADDPEGQAEAVFGFLAASGVSPADAVIAAPDPDVSAALETMAGWRAGPRVRLGAGRPLASSAPVRLLRLVAEHVRGPSRATLAALLRHPDSAEALARDAGALERNAAALLVARWIDELDRFVQARGPGPLPAGGENGGARGAGGQDPEDDRVSLPEALLLAADRLFRPLRAGPAVDAMPAHALRVREALLGVYAGRACAPGEPGDRLTIDACEAIDAALREVESSPASVSPRCSAPDCLDALASAAGAGASPAPHDPEAVEALGWLELAFDPAPVAIITGLNEGVVPAAHSGGALLPDALRAHLGVECDAARFGRDAFLLACACASRPVVRAIAGRRGSDGDPLRPSRILFLCGADSVVERVRRLVEPESRGAPAARGLSALRPGGRSAFVTAPMAGVRPIDSLPVTAFRDYIASPYLFYVKHVLQREERDDGAAELDAMPFGSLLHRALADFARGEGREETREDRIRAACVDALHRTLERMFGSNPPAPIALQALAARQRIERFAAWQARRRALGWRIAHAEWPHPDALTPLHERGLAVIGAAGGPMRLRGRIDRIDFHDDEGAAILDYKSGAQAADPAKAHGGPGKWRDLQLPLYGALAKDAIGDRTLSYRYICLPRSGEVTDPELEWKDARLEDALVDALARASEIVAEIRSGTRFGEVGDAHPIRGAFGALAGRGLLSRDTPESEADAEADGDGDGDARGDDA